MYHRDPYPHLRDPRDIPLCTLCGQLDEWRDGLCAECDHAERNALEAEELEADPERPEYRMTDADVDAFAAAEEPSHRWRFCHYTACGTVVRRCAHCLASRRDEPSGRITYELLSGRTYDAEPVCVPILPAAVGAA